MMTAEARGRPESEAVAPNVTDGAALAEALRAAVLGRGHSVTLTPVRLDELPEDVWENGASIRLYCGLDDVQDFGVFGSARNAGAMVRWLFGYGDDELIAGERLRDGLGETLNQVVGRVKNDLPPSVGVEPRLDTPEVLERTTTEMFARVHSEAAVFLVSSEAWSGEVVFLGSARRQHAIAALEQATTVLLRFGLDRDAMARSCRLLEEVRAPMLALSELPAMGITLSWCIENLAVLVNGVTGYREKALFYRVLRELDSLRAALLRLTAPREATAFHVPEEDDLRLLLADFCDEVGRAAREAEEALAANVEDVTHRLFRTMHALRGNSAFFGLEQVQAVAQGTQNLLGSVRDSGGRLSDQQVDAVRHSLYLIEAWVDELRDALDGDGIVGWSADLEAHARMLEHFIECGGRLALPRLGASTAPDELSEFLRLDEQQLRRLEMIRSELKHWSELAARDVAEVDLEEQRAFFRRSYQQISALCQSVRRVPLAGLLRNLARHCREASQRHGKLVRVDVAGESVTAPEHLIAALSGPLVHLVNNAIEHGVEAAAERQAAGKKVLATVEIRAASSRGELYLEVLDDGRGIQRELVRSKAAALGRLTDELDDALQLVFLPGVSTTDRVDVIDRGAGMDVVKREVDALHGTVEVVSTPGRGTRIRIVVPEQQASELEAVVEDDIPVEEDVDDLEGDGELNFL